MGKIVGLKEKLKDRTIFCKWEILGKSVTTNCLRRVRCAFFILPFNYVHKVSDEAWNQTFERGGIPDQHKLIVDSRLVKLLNH